VEGSIARDCRWTGRMEVMCKVVISRLFSEWLVWRR
jgi:hypothetical protein